MQRNSAGGDTFSWGFSEWGQLFSKRQLATLQRFVLSLDEIKTALKISNSEYKNGLITYLGILIDRAAVANTSFGRWHVGRETLKHPFSKQAIPMIFDYPESNIFCSSTGSGLNQLIWLVRYIESRLNALKIKFLQTL